MGRASGQIWHRPPLATKGILHRIEHPMEGFLQWTAPLRSSAPFFRVPKLNILLPSMQATPSLRRPRLQQIFNNMKLSKPLMPGEVKMLLLQEKDLGERFYGISLPS